MCPGPPDAAADGPGPNRQQEILTATGLAAERILHSQLEPAAFNDVLALLGRATGVSRVYVFENVAEPGAPIRSYQRFEWCGPGVPPEIDNPLLQGIDLIEGGFQRWLSELQSNRAIFGPVACLPPDERPILEAQSILSIAIMPILTHGRLWGFIGFDDCTHEHSWTTESVGCLAVAARVLAAAFERRDFKQRGEEALADYQSLVDHLDDVVFRLDEDGRFTFLSPAWHSLLGWPAQPCLGHPASDYLHPDDVVEFVSEMRSMTQGASALLRRDLRLRSADGTHRWMLMSARPIRGGQDRRPAFAGTLTDISAAKRTEADLIQAHHAAEAANRGKSEFLSTISHELRTPLNGILGLTESLLETEGEFQQERTRRYLGIIHDSGRQLLAQINDILDVARIEAGRIEAHLGPVNLGEICAAAVKAVAAEAGRKSIELLAPPPPTPLILAADARLLRHAVQNLVANAVKFTPEHGRVEVRAQAAPEGGATISVADNGIGIPPESLPKLFRPFSQVDSSLSRRHGGTGLGLFMVDRLVRLQGGHVRVVSSPGVGSTFTIELPGPGPSSGNRAA